MMNKIKGIDLATNPLAEFQSFIRGGIGGACKTVTWMETWSRSGIDEIDDYPPGNDHISPTVNGMFESRIFRLPPGGIWIRSLQDKNLKS